MDMAKSMLIAAAGMRAQSERMRLIAENIANAGSAADKPGADPYRRQVATFKSELDDAMGVSLIRMAGAKPDTSEFQLRHIPGHPAADERGYVKMPNVNSLVEMMDMREAQRSFDANVNVIDASRNMMARAIDLLRR